MSETSPSLKEIFSEREKASQERLKTLRGYAYPRSARRYIPVPGTDYSVPSRTVSLTNGESVDLYDTAGVYGDTSAVIDVTKGAPLVRESWLKTRDDLRIVEGASEKFDIPFVDEVDKTLFPEVYPPTTFLLYPELIILAFFEINCFPLVFAVSEALVTCLTVCNA